jgi:tryptophanyl-tRNA synthetase
MQPSGKFHLGNYMGALENWVKLQYDYECYFSIVDLHALTSSYEDTSKIPENIHNMAVDWLSAGLDPERSPIFVQSHVKEHAELHLLLSMITPLSWLERVPTYKDKIQQLSGVKDLNTYGFMGYPELMTADIILYKAQFVPVGEDQIPHLELAREITRRFNNMYAPLFPEPKELLSKAAILPGIDGRKMSKSYGNDIPFAASPDELRARVKLMVTDPARIKKDDKGHPDVCVVNKFHKIFNEEKYETICAECKAGSIGCVACKKNLADKMVDKMADMHTRRNEYQSKPEKVKEILAFGAERARKVASRTMEEVRKAMNLA